MNLPASTTSPRHGVSVRHVPGSTGWLVQRSGTGTAKAASAAHSMWLRNAVGAEWMKRVPLASCVVSTVVLPVPRAFPCSGTDGHLNHRRPDSGTPDLRGIGPGTEDVGADTHLGGSVGDRDFQIS